MKLWIVGASGLLGSALKELCEEKGIVYVGTSSELDIADARAVRDFARKTEPTHIVNCAAYTAVDQAETERARAYGVNALGPEHVGRAAQETGAHVLHISTNYVFNGESSTPYCESADTDPLNVYGASKREGEVRLLNVCPEACIVRTSWLFGRGGKNFISSILTSLKREKVVRAVSDQYGRATYGPDLAHALLALLGCRGIFHFANQGTLSRYLAASDIKAEAEKCGIHLMCEELVAMESEEFSMPAKRPKNALLATEKIEKLIEVRPWKHALREYLSYAN